MAVSKRKTSPSRRNMRRAPDGVAASAPRECPNCGDIKRPPHASPHFGIYKGREVVAKGEA